MSLDHHRLWSEDQMAKQPESWRQWVAANLLPQANGSAALEPGPANPPPFVSVGMHTVPSFDVIERVPEERKDLFRKICQHVDDACALAVPFEVVRAASINRIEKGNAFRRFKDHPQDDGLGLKSDDPRVVAAEKELAKATDEFERTKQRSEERAEAQQAALRVKATCEDYLRHGVPGNCKLEAVEVEPPKLNKGETVIDGIERLRRRCRELRADLHRIASAPYPSSHAKARMKAQIEAHWRCEACRMSQTSSSMIAKSFGPCRACRAKFTTRNPVPLHSRRHPTRAHCSHGCSRIS
jgi:hypothetical protein